MKNLLSAAEHFNLGAVSLCPDIAVAGSPERTDFRAVVKTADSRLIILEKVNPRRAEHRKAMAAVLAALSGSGMPQVVPFLTDKDGRTLGDIDGECWQAVPYVNGVQLDRPAYAFEGWRGTVSARFLVDFKKATQAGAVFKESPVFDLPAYIDGLWSVIRRRRPEVAQAFIPMKRHVEERLNPFYRQLPTGFCHGDYHALNIIWGESGINAVIDWEFFGVKPELYDAANMLSCLGIEDPSALDGAWADNFMAVLKGSGLYTTEGFRILPDFMIAMRFAWVSEWLRKDDDDMLQMELDYFDILKERCRPL
ncbi:MAG: aminoglycoside phosphotransferase family protein [Candidatus Omnitrophota bacterium]